MRESVRKALDSIQRLVNILISLPERRAIRKLAGARPNTVVVVVQGDAAPQLAGESWHYETKGGTRIDHPGAYARHGWSNMRYVPSTRRVEVGAAWVLARRYH